MICYPFAAEPPTLPFSSSQDTAFYDLAWMGKASLWVSLFLFAICWRVLKLSLHL